MTATTQAIPTRHPDGPRPVPAAFRAMGLVWRLDEPDAQQWDRLGQSLLVGDEPMDQLLEWMVASGLKATKPLFERVLAEGVANVPDAPEPIREFFSHVETVPEWVNWDQIRRGQALMRRSGADGIYVARDLALCGGYMFSSFNQTLLRTGALEKGSNQRFAETLRWALDVVAEGGLDPRGPGYQSTIRVRLIHAFVRRHVAAMPDWQAEDWGVPVNQTDMAATLFGTFMVPASSVIAMGMVPRPGDLDALAHFVRYLGWLIGVKDEWLPHSFRHGMQLLSDALAALSTPDETSKMLAAPMVDDPMVWNYRNLTAIRRRFARAQHLSLTSALGPRAMRTLGLPVLVVPWYPVVRIPINLLRSSTLLIPGGMDRAAARGWREQNEFLRTLTGERTEVGDSVPGLKSAA